MKLNFTYYSATVDGQFNGRFVFRAAADSSELPATTLQALTDGATEEWADDALLHEFLHWRVFRGSPVGQEIIGRRFHARKCFAEGLFGPVVDYYIARTCYFRSAYRIHEGIVHALENKVRGYSRTALLSIRLSPGHRRALALADGRCLHWQREFGVKRRPWQRLVDRLRGTIATREYALQYHAKNTEGIAGLRETSMLGPTQGVINAAFRPDTKETPGWVAWAKKVRRSFNTERNTPLDEQRLALWVAIKFQTEAAIRRELLDRNESRASADAAFERHCVESAKFVLRHLLQPADSLAVSLVAEKLIACGQGELRSPPSPEAVADLADEGHRFLYFFFCHGN